MSIKQPLTTTTEMNLHQIKRGFYLVALITSLIGCVSSKPFILSGETLGSSEIKQVNIDSQSSDLSCKIPIQIQPSNMTNLGYAAGREIKSTDFDGWLKEQIENYSNRKLSFVLSSNEQNNEKAILLIPYKAYLKSISTTISVNLVMGLKIPGVAKEVVLRSYQSNSNWASTDSELDRIFHQAFNNYIHNSTIYLKRYCNNNRVSSN
ncbi:MAG: hypothetical protein Q9M92_02485 [Enterobacterales bacterium]|nr:hypothetical protein [Enterobacterales bacterium]